MASIQCLQNTGTEWDIVVFFEVRCGSRGSGGSPQLQPPREHPAPDRQGSDKSAVDVIRRLGVRVLQLDEYSKALPLDLTEFNKKNEESDTANGW